MPSAGKDQDFINRISPLSLGVEIVDGAINLFSSYHSHREDTYSDNWLAVLMLLCDGDWAMINTPACLLHTSSTL